MSDNRKDKRTELSIQGLDAMLDFIGNLEREHVITIYLYTKGLLSAGRKKKDGKV